MNFLGMGGKQNAGTQPATQLRVQTSVAGLPRPIGWGTNRIAGNLIWYNDFSQSGGGAGGKGGGSGKGGGNLSYSASVIIAICEGPTNGATGLMWTNENTGKLSDYGFTAFSGRYDQGVWSYMAGAGDAGAAPAPIDSWTEINSGPEGGAGSG